MSKAKTKVGTIVFRIIYTLLTLALIGVICYALWHLWHYLEAFEKSQPEIPIKSVVELMNKNKKIFFDELDFELNEFEKKEYAEDYYTELTKGEITYSRNGKKSSEKKTVYTLKNGKNNIANVTIEPVGKNIGYGFCEYEVTDVEFGNFVTNSYSVTAPNYVVVYCNGKIVSDSYITEKGSPDEDEIKYFHNLAADFPYDVVYTIDGFIKEPVFTATDESGNQFELKDGKFDDTHLNISNDELSQAAIDFAQCYSKYIMNDGTFDEAAKYIAPNMKLYDDLYYFKNDWAYSHSSYEFKDVEVKETVFYTKNAASVRISYDHFLYGVSWSISTDGIFCSAADYTAYLVKLDGKWKVTDFIIN